MIIDLNEIKNNKPFRVIMIVLLTLLIVLLVWGLYSYLKKKAAEQPFLIKTARNANYIIDEDGNKINGYQSFSNNDLPAPVNGQNYTYSIWINIDDWTYNSGKPKHIFHKGDREGISVNPGVWLYPNSNNIMIRVDTHSRVNNVNKTLSGKTCQNWSHQYPHQHPFKPSKYADQGIGEHNYCRNPDKKRDSTWCYTTDSKTEWEACSVKDYEQSESMSPFSGKVEFDPKDACDIVNVPLQRWVLLGIVLHNRTLDIFVNGRLTRSCTYEYPPKFNTGELHVTDKGGFSGKLSELKYYNRALSSDEIYSIYRAGYQTFSIYDKLTSITPKISGSMSINTCSN